jgi:Ankyrin repeats (3 copies)/Ankyrin repeat
MGAFSSRLSTRRRHGPGPGVRHAIGGSIVGVGVGGELEPPSIITYAGENGDIHEEAVLYWTREEFLIPHAPKPSLAPSLSVPTLATSTTTTTTGTQGSRLGISIHSPVQKQRTSVPSSQLTRSQLKRRRSLSDLFGCCYSSSAMKATRKFQRRLSFSTSMAPDCDYDDAPRALSLLETKKLYQHIGDNDLNTMHCLPEFVGDEWDGGRELYDAAGCGDIQTVRRYLTQGLHPDVFQAAYNCGDTAFMEACYCGELEIAKLLYAYGADASHSDANGSNALHYAAQGGHVQVITFLLDCGVDMDGQGHSGLTPLMEAAAMSRYKALQYLLRRGANISITDDYGLTVAHHAHTVATQYVLHEYHQRHRRAAFLLGSHPREAANKECAVYHALTRNKIYEPRLLPKIFGYM